jgi:Hint domain
VAAKRSSITRRNLVAASAAVVAALATKAAHAKNGHGHGNGHGNGRGGGGGGANCILRGTIIRTPDGEREISDLRIGDLVVTYSGAIKPIKWIGRRRLLREATEAWPNAVMPIKVTRSALGVNTPHSDLFLSPGHALYLDGLLITVGSLVNDRTIVRQAPDEADALEYFQIELFDHDILYANGAAAETLFAVCDRTLFDNRTSTRRSMAARRRPD